MNRRWQEGVRTVGFMTALTAVLIAGVAALHLATAARVRRNAGLFLQRAVLEAAGFAPPADAAVVAEWFRERVTAEPPGQAARFQVRETRDGALRAQVFVRSGKGLWGPVVAVVALAPDLRTFGSMRILEQNETPGLGARICEPWFLEQFAGKTGPFRLTAEGTRSAVPTEMDAVTGATITSVAVRDLLNALARERGTGGEESE